MNFFAAIYMFGAVVSGFNYGDNVEGCNDLVAVMKADTDAYFDSVPRGLMNIDGVIARRKDFDFQCIEKDKN
jgi:hypothetical protein